MRVDYRNAVAYLLLVAGTIMSIWVGWSLGRAYFTHDWPQTDAIIYQSSLVYTTSTPKQKYFKVVLKYQYKVENHSYSNQSIYLTDLPFLKLEEAKKLIGFYAIGSIHKLSYNPALPEDSVLKPGISNVLLLLTALAILFLCIGFAARKK